MSLNQISYWAGNQNLLSTAIAGSKYDLAKLLIERGADPNFRIPDTGNTALHEALKSVKMKVGQITKEFIRYLLQKGADCQRTNNQQKNAFEFAEKFKD